MTVVSFQVSYERTKDMGRFELTDGSENGLQSLVNDFMENIFNRETVEKLVREAVKEIQEECQRLDDLEENDEDALDEVENLLSDAEKQTDAALKIVYSKLNRIMN